MKGLMDKIRNVNWKKSATDAVELTVGTVGFVGVGIVEGGLYVGKHTVEGTKMIAEQSISVGKVIKDKCGDVDVQAYKDKVKGFTVKESK